MPEMSETEAPGTPLARAKHGNLTAPIFFSKESRACFQAAQRGKRGGHLAKKNASAKNGQSCVSALIRAPLRSLRVFSLPVNQTCDSM